MTSTKNNSICCRHAVFKCDKVVDGARCVSPWAAAEPTSVMEEQAVLTTISLKSVFGHMNRCLSGFKHQAASKVLHGCSLTPMDQQTLAASEFSRNYATTITGQVTLEASGDHDGVDFNAPPGYGFGSAARDQTLFFSPSGHDNLEIGSLQWKENQEMFSHLSEANTQMIYKQPEMALVAKIKEMPPRHLHALVLADGLGLMGNCKNKERVFQQLQLKLDLVDILCYGLDNTEVVQRMCNKWRLADRQKQRWPATPAPPPTPEHLKSMRTELMKVALARYFNARWITERSGGLCNIRSTPSDFKAIVGGEMPVVGQVHKPVTWARDWQQSYDCWSREHVCVCISFDLPHRVCKACARMCSCQPRTGLCMCECVCVQEVHAQAGEETTTSTSVDVGHAADERQSAGMRMAETEEPLETPVLPGQSQRVLDICAGVMRDITPAEMFSRWNHFMRFKWTTANKGDWIIARCDVTKQLQACPFQLPRMLTIHAFFNCDLKFKLQLNSNRFQVGRLAMVWVPPSKEWLLDEATNPGSVEGYTTMPHVIVDAALNTPATLSVPFAQVRNYISTMSGRDTMANSLGRLAIVQLTGLYVPTDAPGHVQGTVWIAASNVATRVPTASHQLFSTQVIAQGEIAEQLSKTAGDLAQRTVSSAVRTGLRAIPILGNLLDRPLNYEWMAQRRPLGLGPLCLGDGGDSAVRLSLHVHREPQNRYKGGMQQMHAAYLTKMSSVVLRLKPKWLTGEGEQRFFLPIHPRLSAPPTDLKKQTVQAGYLNYVSSMFLYWRGSLTFHIEVVCPYFATGRLAFTWLPDVDANVLLGRENMDDLTAYPTVILDIAEAREITFDVPFIATTPVKLVPTIVHTSSTQFLYCSESSNGVLVVHVINEMVSPPSSADYVSVWIWLSGGDDFELMVPAGPFDAVAPQVFSDKQESLKKVVSEWVHSKEPEKKIEVESEVTYDEKKKKSQYTKNHRYSYDTTLKDYVYDRAGRFKWNGTSFEVFAQGDDGSNSTLLTTRTDLFFNGGVPFIGSKQNTSISVFGEDFMDLRPLLKRRMLVTSTLEGKEDAGGNNTTVMAMTLTVTPLVSMTGQNLLRQKPSSGEEWISIAVGNMTANPDLVRNVTATPNLDFVCFNVNNDSFLSMISRIFTFYSGSLRYSLATTSDATTMGLLTAEFVPGPSDEFGLKIKWSSRAAEFQTTAFAEPRGNFACVVDNRALNPTLEVEVPIQGLYDHLYVDMPTGLNKPAQLLTCSPGVLCITSMKTRVQEAAVSWASVARLYAGAGNDFQLYLPVWAPPIQRYLGRSARTSKGVVKGLDFMNDGVVAQMGWSDIIPYMPSKTVCGIAGAGLIGFGMYKMYARIQREVTRLSNAMDENLTGSRVAIETMGMEVARVSERLTSTLSSFEGSVSSTSTDFGETLRAVTSLTKNAGHLLDKVHDGLLGILMDIFGPEGMKDLAPHNLMNLIFLIYDGCTLRSNTDIVIFIGKISTTLPFLNLTKSVISYFASLPEHPNMVTAQGGMETLADIFKAVSAAHVAAGSVLVVIVLLYCQKMVTTNRTSLLSELQNPRTVYVANIIGRDVLATFYDLGKISMSLFGITRAYPLLIDLMDKVLCLIKGDLTEAEQSRAEIKHISHSVELWADGVVRMNQDQVRMQMSHDSRLQREAQRLFFEGKELYVKTLREGIPPGVGRAFTKMLDVARTLDGIATRSKDNLGFRREPFCFAICGKPGLGKTALIMKLACFLGAVEEHGRPNDCYPRSTEDEFWSNYTKQHITLYDDFPKTNSQEGNRVMSEFINVKSCNPYPLNMADLPDKGLHFTSKIIGVTTNSPYFTPPSMLEPGAFLRRRDVLVRMRVEGQLDDGHTHANARFRSMNPLVDDGKGDEIDLCGLQDLLMKKFIKHCENEAVRLRAIGLKMDVVLGEFDGLARTWAEQKLRMIFPDDFVSAPVVSQMLIECRDDEQFADQIHLYTHVIEHPCIQKLFLFHRWGRMIKQTFNSVLLAFESGRKALLDTSVAGQAAFLAEIEARRRGMTTDILYGVEWARQKFGNDLIIPPEYFTLISSVTFDVNNLLFAEAQVGDEQLSLIPSTSAEPPRRPVVFRNVSDVELPPMPLARCERAMFSDLLPPQQMLLPSYAELALTADAITRSPEPISAAEMLRERFSPEEWEIIAVAATRPDTLAKLASEDRRIAQLLAFNRGDGLTDREILTREYKASTMVALRRQLAMIGGTARDIWTDHFAGRENWWRSLGLVAAACLPIGFLVWYLCIRTPSEQHEADDDEGPIIEDVESGVGKPVGGHNRRQQKDGSMGRHDEVVLILDEDADPQLEEQSPPKKDRDWSRSKKLRRGPTHDKRARKGAAFRKRGGYTAQFDLDADQNLDDMMRKVRERHVVEIVCERGARKMVMSGIVVGGRVALFPAHYFILLDSFKEDLDLILIVSPHNATGSTIPKKISFKYSEMQVRYYDLISNATIDLCSVLLPPQVGVFANIKNYFLTDDDIDANSRCGFILDVYSPRPDGKRRMIKGDASLSRSTDNYCVRYKASLDHSEEAMVLTDAWYMANVTHKGECGALFYVKCPHKTTGRIAGMHVAGNGNNYRPMAYSIVIPRETVEEALEAFASENAIACADELPVAVKEGSTVVCQGAIENFGTSTITINTPRKSSWMRTEVWSEEIFPHTKDLSVLSNRDPRLLKPVKDILWKAVLKYGEGSGGISSTEFNDLTTYWSQVFKNNLTPYEGPPLSYSNALHCPDWLKEVSEMDPKTSAGFPYVVMGIKKRDIFADDECGIISLARKNYDARLESARKGELYPTVWMDVLKDERRKMSKIREGATRSFIIAPIDLNLLIRSFYLEFVNNLMQARHVLWMQLGINPESSEWNVLANRLVAFGGWDGLFDGDYKNFDGKVHPWMWILFAKCVNTWCADGVENSRVRMTLAHQLCNRFSIAGNTEYFTVFGNPSGCALTTAINSFTNATLLRLAWYRVVFARRGLRSLISFDKHFLDINFGDDVVFAVRDLDEEWLMAWLLEIQKMGHTFTDGGKEGPPHRKPLSEITFLKRFFRQCDIDRVFYGGLEWDSIYSMVHFVKNRGHYPTLLADNVNTAMRAAFFRGREDYDWFISQIKRSMVIDHYGIDILSYDDMYLEIFGLFTHISL
ncbi:polyprotein [Sugar beet cyst nematode virus 1]|uniref:polyprotein n=1 Tax=Sugar beet cyst nematode virus 1 TaxID=1965225 RepID=UPI000CA28649|nr:polyprotein [Sugar beet cyst nematode virus 1]ARA91660.1 polyprotein [Sugar beet cyst nematode virus 1]